MQIAGRASTLAAVRSSLFGALGSMLASLAVAGPPFQTDDPAVVGLRHVEILAYYQSTLAAAGRTGTVFGLEFHYGLFEKTEFDVITPYAFSFPSGGATERGYGDTVVGVKYQLIPETEDTPLVSAVPKASLSTGNSDRGLGNGGNAIFLALAAEKNWGNFQTYGNAGYWINNGANNRNYWFAGWQAQYRFDDHWTLGAEVFYNGAPVSGQSSSVGFNAGGYYVIDANNQILFSMGRGLKNASETNRVSTYVGYQLSF